MDELQKEYARNTDTAERRHKMVLDIVSQQQPDSILDVGCGDGVFTSAIGDAAEVNRIAGTDVSKEVIDDASNRGIDAHVSDINSDNLPFADNEFDMVTALEVFEHLFNPDNLLSEARRVLKPEGLLVITTPNLASLHNRLALLLGYQPFPIMGVSHKYRLYGRGEDTPMAADHIRVVTLDAMKRLLNAYSYSIDSIDGCTFSLFDRNEKEKVPFPLSLIFGILVFGDRLLSNFPSLSYRMVVTARA